MEKVFGLDPPADKHTIPLMYQGGSDDLLGANADVPVPSEALGMDFEAEIGVIVDDVPMGMPAARALGHVKLIVLINDVSLRALAGREMKTGFGWIQAKPSSSFAPVAVTPDGARRGVARRACTCRYTCTGMANGSAVRTRARWGSVSTG